MITILYRAILFILMIPITPIIALVSYFLRKKKQAAVKPGKPVKQ